MKKKSALLFSILILISISCEESLELNKEKSPSEPQTIGSESITASPHSSLLSSCGGTFNGTYSVINSYHIYSLRTIDVSCAATNATITVNCTALDVPNKFTILDASNNMVVGSSWLGNASYPGPWGGSLSNSGTTTLTFPKNGNTYKLRVETLTPPNHSYSPTTDYWHVNVSCTCSSCTTCPCVPCQTGYTCENGTCVEEQGCSIPCGGYFDGQYNVINSYHIYPIENFDVTCASSNSTISVNVTALDVPNKFTIMDVNSNSVVGSGWLGNASYPGPWGSSLSNSGSASLSFQKNGNSYKLRVETLTPPNHSYYPTTDYWSTNISCPN